jgi:hypothetical protein
MNSSVRSMAAGLSDTELSAVPVVRETPLPDVAGIARSAAPQPFGEGVNSPRGELNPGRSA